MKECNNLSYNHHQNRPDMSIKTMKPIKNLIKQSLGNFLYIFNFFLVFIQTYIYNVDQSECDKMKAIKVIFRCMRFKLVVGVCGHWFNFPTPIMFEDIFFKHFLQF